MKKVLCFVLFSFMILPCAFMMFACGSTTPKAQMSAKEIYALSAVSGASYFSAKEDVSIATMSEVQRPEQIADDIPTLNEYIAMLEDYLVEGKTDVQSSVPVFGEDGEYASQYNIKLEMTLPNLAGGEDVFKIYYNEVATQTTIKIEEDEEEVEVSTTLEGVVVFGEKVYVVNGEREVETEGNETDTSISFITKNGDDFLKVEQETEMDEMELSYTLKVNGATTKTSVEIEKDDDGLEMELTLFNGATRSNKNYKIKYAKQGATPILLVRYYVNGKKSGEFTITIDGNNYIYTYGEENSETFAK